MSSKKYKDLCDKEWEIKKQKRQIIEIPPRTPTEEELSKERPGD